MPAAAIDGHFAGDLVRQHVSPELFTLSQTISYYLLDSDFEVLRAGIASDGEATILTGLLSGRNLQIVVSGDLVCDPIGQLRNWPQALLCLAICYGRVLLSSSEPTMQDLEVLGQNGVDALWSHEDMVVWILKRLRRLRIEGHWTLHEEGTIRPRDVLGVHFATARGIFVYDRFFRRATLETLIDALQFARQQRGGKVNCKLTIFHGEPGKAGNPEFVDYATVAAELGKLLGKGSVVLEQIARGPAKRHWLHDRFVQIDESSTFLFTAGIGCFFEGRNAARPNRSGHILQFRVDPEFEEFEFFVVEGGRATRRAIRT